MLDNADTLQQLNDLVSTALKAGADAADAVDIKSVALSHAQRLGEVEKVERAESRDLGLRVFIGKKQAVASSTDSSKDALAELVQRAIDMAKAVPEDTHCGLADAEEVLRGGVPELDLADPEEPSTETLTARARDCEAAARVVLGVSNSEGAEASWSSSNVAIAASNGFAGAYRSTGHGFGVAVLAGEGTEMERDYESTSATFSEDLEAPEVVGQTAGQRAVARLKPRKVETQQVPVVFAPRVANGLLRHLAAAVNGAAVGRGTSFLKDSMGERILPKGVHIIDDPHRKRGHRSKPFDAEGIPNDEIYLVKDGMLENWVLDLATARKLDLPSNGRASRGTSSPPSPGTTNLYMPASQISPSELIVDITEGFYVTDLMGFGINNVTGDYSRGATGFWIENGTISYPVSEVTIASNLKNMFLNLTQADDLRFKYGTDAPTIRIESMTVAGN
ncbi:MAG: Metalloprotease PmbA [Alphaproteobacteria bacterium MarineAlpha4_Bin2]|nr:MAG: Metalloprotease PmbA [Alphaproteobacteria bacterium MarineAlpha4_Bin2]